MKRVATAARRNGTPPLRNPATCCDRCLACEPRAPGAVHTHRIAERAHRLQRQEGSSIEGTAQSGRAAARSMDTVASQPASSEPIPTAEGVEGAGDGKRPTAAATTTRAARWGFRKEASAPATSAPAGATAMPIEQRMAGDVAAPSTDTGSIPPLQTPMGELTADEAPTASEGREFRSEDRELSPIHPPREPEPSVPSPVISEEQTHRPSRRKGLLNRRIPIARISEVGLQTRESE